MNNVIEKLKQVAPLAENHDVILGVESLLSVEGHRHIVDSVGSPNIQVYYDVANSHRVGYDIYREIESLGSDLICEIHLMENNSLLGNGAIDFKKVRRILTKIGYQNWLIIEGSKRKDHSLEDAYKLNSAYARSVFRA